MTIPPVTIAPFQTGWNTDQEPWLQPLDSFPFIDNFHVHHGYIEKRSGFEPFSNLTKLDTAVAISNISQAANGVVTTVGNHNYSTGDLIFLYDITTMTEANDTVFTITVTAPTTFELNVSTVSFTPWGAGTGSAGKVIADTDRVMGIHRFVESDGTETTLAFNTTRGNVFNGANDRFDPLDGDVIMDGSNTDYIWAVNWDSPSENNRLYFTNGKIWDGATLNGIRYYDGSKNKTNTFNPTLNDNGTRVLYGGRLLFVIRSRLVVLYTYEATNGNPTTHHQRARWCQAQGPSTWDDVTPGKGGFVDAPTGDQIISARSLQDQIIVQFTNSVWALQPIPDPALPFRWVKINDFRGVNGKMATAEYDRHVFAVGVRGITATDGVETRRIDNRIENFVTDYVNNEGLSKTFCYRDYGNRRLWSLYSSSENDNANEIDAALILDEESLAFTRYIINMNVLGTGNRDIDYALSDFTAANNLDWVINPGPDEGDGPGDETLQDFYWQKEEELVLGGDINGNIRIMSLGSDDAGSAIAGTFQTASWNPYKEHGKEARLSYVDMFVDSNINTRATIEFYKDNETFPYVTRQLSMLPDQSFIGTVESVQLTNPCKVYVPDHGLTTGDQVFIYVIKGTSELNGLRYTVTVIDNASITLDGIDATAYTAYTGYGVLTRNRADREKVWKRVYAGGVGYQHHMVYRTSDINGPNRIHSLKPQFYPIGKRTIQ